MNLPNMQEAKKRNNEKVETLYNDYNIPLSLKEFGIDKTYYIETYGCQMNVHDSESLCAILDDINLTKIDDMNKADVIVLNTCAIRENAHNKVFGILGRIKHLKETRKDVITIVCGCMPQEESVVDALKEKYKWVDIIFGTHNIHKLPILLNDVITDKKQNIEVFSIEGNIYENIPVKRESKYKAWVNIMYGCDKFCTYCVVPYTRGKQRSRNKDDILKEINDLITDGYLEITLLGQNVNAYGKDLNINYTLANLLEDAAKTGIPRIRFITSHPWDFTDEMIDVISKYSNIMPYVHLPIQSGSNRILKLMGRKYTSEDYIKLFEKIKNKIPNASISTDIIVGFPGETESDFNKTLEIVNMLKFDLAYTFIFSKREGTPAALLNDDTPLDEKKERLYALNKLINKYAREKNDNYLDKVVPVLIEGSSEKEGFLMGYTDTMKLVNIKCDISYIGKIVNVKITSSRTWSLDGEILND